MTDNVTKAPPKVDVGAIARTIVLVVALINQVLTMYGKNPLPFSDDEIYMAITTVFTVVATAIAWWKNNSFSQAAITADETLKELKKK